MAIDDTIRASALDWAVRVGDPAFEDWEAFTAWLEENPSHALAYERAMAAAADAADTIRTAAPANDIGPVDEDQAHPARPTWRKPWFGAAIAASLVAVLAFWLMPGSRDPYRIESTPGEVRTVALGTGTHIDLAGGSTIELDHDNPRFARLIDGRALFTVQHDASHPFEVAVGAQRLVDIGTVFDVRHEDGALAVAVSEGAVQFDPDGADVRISPGEILRRANGTADYTLGKLPVEQVGEWRQGRLTFTGASLAEVAAELTRATGISFVAAPSSAGATISGSVLTAPLKEHPASLGPLLGVAVKDDGKRWVIGTR